MVNAVRSPVSHPTRLAVQKNLCKGSNTFISFWRTDNAGDSNDNQITIRTTSRLIFNCRVYWGDGTDDYITSYDDPAWTHTYPAIGDYEVRIEGFFNEFAFGNQGDRQKLMEIRQWGVYNPTDLNSQFYGCRYVTMPASDKMVFTLTGLFNFFRDCEQITTFPSLRIADISRVEGMNNFFRECINLEEDFSIWDTSSVTTVNNMFRDCPAIDFDMGSWNITSITSAVNFLGLSQLSTANYDSTLIGWESQDVNDNISVHFGTSTYSTDAAAARAALIADHSWTITDGGAA